MPVITTLCVKNKKGNCVIRKFLLPVLSLMIVTVLGWFSLDLKSVRKFELNLMYSAYTHGSGFDEAVTDLILGNKERYAQSILQLIKVAKPDTKEENIIIVFVEHVLMVPEVEDALINYENNHPSQKIRETLGFIRKGNVKFVPLENSRSNKVEASVVEIDYSGSKENK